MNGTSLRRLLGANSIVGEDGEENIFVRQRTLSTAGAQEMQKGRRVLVAVCTLDVDSRMQTAVKSLAKKSAGSP
jgi:cold shock CspA family protein